MLDNYNAGKGKASAYGNRRHSIGNIPKGSTVYLYHNRIEVIAKGITTGKHERHNKEEEFYVPLNFCWALQESEWDKAVKAQQINEGLNTSHRFRRAVFTINEDMAKAIDALHAETASYKTTDQNAGSKGF